MRVLCLHPEKSSAYQFSEELQKLEERLWTKHAIELVFVDGPLLDVQVGTAIGEEGGGINAIESSCINSGNDGEERVSRRWYVEEESRRAITQQSSTIDSSPQPQTSQIQYSGLDASILHLSQIWTRGGANISNNLGECLPFQGVLGVGQGANVASLLPLLNYQNDEDEVDCEKENSNTKGGLTQHTKPSMFQGLRFVISIDGKDILSRRDVEDNVNNGSEEDENEEVYVGPDGVQSLHVINTESDTYQSSEQLAKQYGKNTTIHHYKQQQQSSTTTTTHITPTLSNIIGKYLVSQKNKLHSNPKSRELISLQNQLANVEQLATLAISQEIQKNPPKALMAVIGPTAMMSNDTNDEECDKDGAQGKEVEEEDNVKVVDKAVGAWHGARRRGFGEEGGGAPCPGEFLLREEERQGAVTSAAKSSSLVNPKDPNARLV